jgi:hypothetical protein
MTQRFSHGYALLIGVGTCDYHKWSLPVTVKDACALKDILTDPNLCAYPDDEGHLCLLYDAAASRAGILEGLTWLQTQTIADGEATAVVYFSGHGWLDNKSGCYYLIPSDVEPYDIPSTAISAGVFTDALRQVAARRLLVIIDSCHAEGMASAKGTSLPLPAHFTPIAPPIKMIAELKQGEGRAVFSSSRGTQLSWIRTDSSLSIYTYHLLEALQGANNQVGETHVRISNLMNHLSKAVPDSSRLHYQEEQTPFFDMSTEDFVIALLHGGKGLSASVMGGQDNDRRQNSGPTVNVRGDGNIVGNHNISQIIKASGGGRISNVTQTAGSSPRAHSPASQGSDLKKDSAMERELQQLSEMLLDHFSRAEIRSLCQRMLVNLNELPGQPFEEALTDFLRILLRQGRSMELIEHCRGLKPTLKWP